MLDAVRALMQRVQSGTRSRERRFHAYCTGTPKSGTHSIVGLLQGRYRAAHEPDRQQLLDAARAWGSGAMTEAARKRFVRRRDRRLRLEMDSSAFNEPFIDLYVRLFPEARFILTIRDPYSWLDSCFNHRLGRGVSPELRMFLEWWYRPGDYEHGPGEEPLSERGLYPLGCYLSLWARHNERVLRVVPSDRLLVVRTNEIDERVGEIADFLALPAQTLDDSHSHEFRAPEVFGVLAELDRDQLRAEVDRTCGELMERIFPRVDGPPS